MAILDEAKNPQPRDQQRNVPFATAGMGTGVGGGIVQGTAPSPAPSPAPSGGGGGGGGGGGAAPAASDPYAALKALSAAGLSSADIVALAGGGGGEPAAAAPAPSVSTLDTGFSSTPLQAPNFTPTPAVGEQFPTYSPELLAILAGYDQQLNDQVSGYRRQQDEANRSLADALPELVRSFDLNRESVKDAFEGRGLLKSGETEQAVGRTYEDQGRRQSQLQQQTADQIANIEQQIAAARVANQLARNQALYGNAGNVSNQIVGSVA